MNNILRIFIVIILTFFIPSCKKDTIDNNNIEHEDNNNTEHDKYIIEMNSEYRLSRVTHIVDNNTVEYEKSYEYSEKYVKVQTKNGSLSTYFLNQNGLADSCHLGIYSVQYQYDKNSFLISLAYQHDSPIYYEYANGNKIKFTYGSNSSYSQYTSQINLVDIDSFDGTYLGKLNQNLLQTQQMVFQMLSSGLTTVYQYTLNASGLVMSRISTTIYNSREPQKKLISEFEYIINK
jgi:hypothetical protein